jgi:hypothetical protein
VNEPLVVYRRHAGGGSQNARKMIEDDYYVLSKALRSDPELMRVIGRDKALARMCELAFQAGYVNVDAGDLGCARRYFREALSYRRSSLKALGFWASTFLPPRLRSGLRRAKQRLWPAVRTALSAGAAL